MSAKSVPIALFRLGKIVATANAIGKLSQDDILMGLQRHQAGDWGDLDEHDRAANNHALAAGTRLLSAYRSATGLKFWVITEADRQSTSVLMPEDY
jgi:hypothetical protein